MSLCGSTILTWRRQKSLGSDTEYQKEREMYNSYFAGSEVRYRTYAPGSNTSLRFHNDMRDQSFASRDGDYQDLIMWEQLTDAARVALNNSESFEKTEVPFSDEHYEVNLDKA
ncbi:hypothetical protein DVH05_010066 [Phytophthora capsici]|nr:hypothetical protein DVH05_010066 [Phytophthora capsici]